MRIKTVRLWLLILFVASLVAHLGVFAYTYFTESIYPDDFEALALQILAIYSIPLGVILGGFFAQGDQKEAWAAPSVFFPAFALSILWSGLLLVRTFAFGFAKEDLVEDLMRFLQNISAASMFLIAGVLAFFFAKKGAVHESVPDDSKGIPDDATS